MLFSDSSHWTPAAKSFDKHVTNTRELLKDPDKDRLTYFYLIDSNDIHAIT